MAVFLWQNTFQQFLDQNGEPLNGGKVFFYAAGSSTKQNTFTDSTGTVPNANPMILDAAGNLQQAVWLTGGQIYKVGVTASTEPDPPVNFLDPWPLDNIKGIGDTTTSFSEWIASGLTPTFVSTTSFAVAGDQSSVFPKGRELQIVDAGGTKYAVVTNVAFAALTTVTVAVHGGGVLASPLSSVAYGIVNPVNPSINADEVDRKANAVASAATTDIWSGAGNTIHVTGTTGPITSFGTAPYAGNQRTVIFDAATSITTGANLRISGLASATTLVMAAGDVLQVVADTTTAFIGTLARAAVKQPTLQKFTSGSGTYTTPAGVSWIRVRMVGGGGGGGGSTSTAANNGGTGGTGGNTTWATTLLVANGGTGGAGVNTGNGGTGGSTANTAGPLMLVSLTGSAGQSCFQSSSGNNTPGGLGGPSPFGGLGLPGNGSGTVGGAAQTNSGSGGSGGGAGASGVAGGGGGSGGYVEAIINSPIASYAYAVGAAGTAGAAGTSGLAGGAGGSGVIIVEEYYY